MRRWWLAAVLGLALLAAPAWAASPPDESRFLTLANQARADAGLGPLRSSPELVAAARRHADEMAAQGRIYHSPDPNGGVDGWQSAAENVGRGTSADHVHGMLMNSPSHRANILDRRFSEVGMGVTWRDGTLYVTQYFRQPVAPAPAPETTVAPSPAPSPATTAAVRPRRPAAAPRVAAAPGPTTTSTATTTTTSTTTTLAATVDEVAAAPAVQVAVPIPRPPARGLSGAGLVAALLIAGLVGAHAWRLEGRVGAVR